MSFLDQFLELYGRARDAIQREVDEWLSLQPYYPVAVPIPVLPSKHD